MAYFKISLLTPRYKNSDIYFIEDAITEWDSPLKEYSLVTEEEKEAGIHKHPLSFNIHSLTYNEKFTKHQNGQKELTFSMNKNIARQDEWFENPFCNLISIGTQLLLVDQYRNHYIFTVSNIKFNFKENNIIYDVSCQDSFSYQLTRQNNGYEIVNDSSSEDFIGAKTLDWWVTQKIAKECYLYNYTYIPLFKGLYKTTADTISFIYTSFPETSDVAEIIKEIYSTEDDKNYYETIPFSCSGVSAAGALIALGDTLNMQLVVFEHINQDGLVLRYFWFEPKKNDKRVNLTYSPNKDIQSFGLSHKGESLTTILNVNGPTYDDELITLIPSIPSFWASYIESNEWLTSQYSEGFFGSLYKNHIEIMNITPTSSIRLVDNHYDIPISNDIMYHLYYNKFNFDKDTIVRLSNNQTLSSVYSTFLLVRKFSRASEEVEEKYYEYNILPLTPENNEQWYVRVLYSSNQPGVTTEVSSAHIAINFYRDYTDAEEDFARAADACPWLENKIIDFNYFYENNIISKQEYQDISNLFNNKLRIINGQLLWYSQAHYNALHYQTKLIADLTNKLDLLGATFESDFISPLTDHGSLATDISDFTSAYNNIFGNLHTGTDKTLINLEDLKEEYATKYFNAQQRFLKNIYNFRNYFEQTNGLYQKNIYEHTLQISSANNNKVYSFDTISWKAVDSDFNLYDNLDTKKPFVELYRFKDNQLKPEKIAYKYQSNLYRLETTQEQWGNEPLGSTVLYNNQSIYAEKIENTYKVLTKDEIIKKYLQNLEEIPDNWYIYSKDLIYQSFSNIHNHLNSLNSILTSDALLSSLNSVGRSLDTVNLNILKKYIPLNTIYKKAPRYKIQLRDNSYYWYRLNAKGETVLDYKEYLKNSSKEEKQIKDLIEVKNPFNNSELVFLPYDFVTPDNELHKYRLVRDYYTLSAWSWIGVLLSEKSTLLETNVWLSTFINKTWATSGGPDYNINGENAPITPLWLESDIYYVTDTSWKNQKELYQNSFSKANISHSGSEQDIKKIETWNQAWVQSENGYIVQDYNSGNPQYTSFKYNLEENKMSYMFGSALQDFKYRCNQYYLLNSSDTLYINGNYYVCCISSNGESIYNTRSSFIDYVQENTLDDIADYPLTTRFIRLDNIAAKYNKKSLSFIITNMYSTADIEWINNCICKITISNKTLELMFFKQEMYERIYMSVATEGMTQLQAGDFVVQYYKELYDSDTNDLINYDEIPGLVKGLYQLQVPSSDVYIPIDWSTWTNLDINFYTYNEEDKNYYQVYTVEQIKTNDNLNFQYIKSSIKTEKLFLNKPSSYSFGIIEYDKTNNSIKTINKFFTINPEDWTGTSSYSFRYNDIQFTLIIDTENPIKITQKTNGEFWSAYHNAIDNPILMQQAIGIETQLTEYWSSAYIASKYCEYFIPEHWHPMTISDINYFKVMIQDSSGNISLSTQYVPIVKILQDSKHNIDLPRYIFKRSIMSHGQTPNTEEEFKDKIIYHTSSELNNIVIQNAFNNIGEDINSWIFEEAGKMKYYYVDKNGNGTTWTNLATQYNQQFSEFSGLYIMFYKILSTYTNQDESRYYELLKQHDNFWAEMYKKYGYLLLENVYTNEDATNSADLLKMAQLYFKDLNTPERAYNITVIDTASLMNYNGAEIRLGDGIQVRANEFYNEYDSIYQSLSQILFVSDIGYSLRNVTDISLTVNDIKYSDKMIQRLAKLLR